MQCCVQTVLINSFLFPANPICDPVINKLCCIIFENSIMCVNNGYNVPNLLFRFGGRLLFVRSYVTSLLLYLLLSVSGVLRYL